MSWKDKNAWNLSSETFIFYRSESCPCKLLEIVYLQYKLLSTTIVAFHETKSNLFSCPSKSQNNLFAQLTSRGNITPNTKKKYDVTMWPCLCCLHWPNLHARKMFKNAKFWPLGLYSVCIKYRQYYRWDVMNIYLGDSRVPLSQRGE